MRSSAHTAAAEHPPEADGLDEGAEHVAAPVLQRQARDGAPAQRVCVRRAVALHNIAMWRAWCVAHKVASAAMTLMQHTYPLIDHRAQQAISAG